MRGTLGGVLRYPSPIYWGTMMPEIDKPKPALTLIDCDRTELERRLMHLACSDSSSEFQKAIDAFTSRAKLRVVVTNDDDTEEQKKEDSP